MDSGSNTALAAAGRERGGDRLSRLGDTVLGHILSFLPSTEAARAATLSRRWRHVFAAVHTLWSHESEDPLAMGYQWWKPRGDSPGPGDNSVPDDTQYVTPRSLFSCAALGALRLGSCWLDLPSAIALPFLDTLHLTRVDGRTGAVQRLVSACPRLADLTLEACFYLTEISIVDARLRRLALQCCHNLAAVAVAVASSELRAFEYRGPVLGPSFLTLHGPRAKVSFCTIDLCGAEQADQPALASLAGFLRLFVCVERLHLTSARLGSGVGHAHHPSSAVHTCNWECVFGHGSISSTLELPSFPALSNLELTGMLPDDDTLTITAVTRIPQRTPSLDTLSLFFFPEPIPVRENGHWYRHLDEEGLHAAHKLRYNQHARLAVPPDVEIPACLTERTKEINLVHYQGAMAQRALAKFLLCNAPAVDEVYCEFAPGPLLMQTKLMAEVKEWVMNKSANMTFF
ncbi:hypothetical protein BS78_05G226000 [Paspalum vaginatum]|nr:hypothetical protein BS78_05G226000 [Paspalum vaginatum]